MSEAPAATTSTSAHWGAGSGSANGTCGSSISCGHGRMRPGALAGVILAAALSLLAAACGSGSSAASSPTSAAPAATGQPSPAGTAGTVWLCETTVVSPPARSVVDAAAIIPSTESGVSAATQPGKTQFHLSTVGMKGWTRA